MGEINLENIDDIKLRICELTKKRAELIYWGGKEHFDIISEVNKRIKKLEAQLKEKEEK